MWKKKYTRILDLREPQNKSWMSRGNEISQLLMDGVFNGKLTGYTSDSLNQAMTIEAFLSKLTIPGSETDEDPLEDCCDDDDTWPTDEDNWEEDEVDLGPELYLANQLYILQITEDALYNKKESRMRYEIESITLYIPADLPDNLRGVQDHLITFKYEDCVKYFEELNQFVWFNRQNSQEHRSFSDAFDLRLFASTIVKVENPDDLYIEDEEGSPEKGIIGSKKAEYKLMETEHEMYEF